jgi:hypothetical protein
MADLVFEAPQNSSNFFQMMEYFNSLTDVTGAGSVFWLVMLVVMATMIFLMMKGFTTEKSLSVTFIITFTMAFLLRLLDWVNDYVVAVTAILAIFGLYMLMKDESI